MPRESDKHGPRVDEEMDKETQSMTSGGPTDSRAEEKRESEGPTGAEDTPDHRLRGDRGMTSDVSLTPDEVEARQDLARFLEGAAFPGTREELVDSARSMDATEPVLRQLSELPGGRTFENLQEVWTTLGGRPERRTS